MKVCKDYIEENLRKGFITHSTSPYTLLVLFVKKPGGGIRFCVNYRKLNALTKKDRYPLPLVKEVLAKLVGIKYFTKLDIIYAFNRVRFAILKDKDLTSFCIYLGSFKYRVLPFGLYNSPSVFQYFINETLGEYLNACIAVYIDDCLIYSRTRKEYIEYVCGVI